MDRVITIFLVGLLHLPLQTNGVYGFLNIDMLNNGQTLQGTFFANDGSIKDQFTIQKGQGSGTNTPPTANAGPDQTVNEGTTPVTLDGSGSSDSDGTIASYAWTQTAGPSVTLSSSSAQKPTFTAPQVTQDTTLTFSLVVKDNSGASSAANTVNILVKDGAATNTPPTANAGPDQTVNEGTTPVTLDGSGSSDSDGTIASYAWTQTAGPSVTLSSSSAQKPTFTAPQVTQDTTLTFSLVVKDNSGASSAANTVNILVKDGAATNTPYHYDPSLTLDGT